MAGLSYPGPTPAGDYDLVNDGYLQTLLGDNLPQATVDSLIAAGLAGYATTAYVTQQDALNATQDYIDTRDATRLHLTQVGANNGVAGLDSTGRIGPGYVNVASTQRWPKSFWSPVQYIAAPVTVSQTTAGTYSWICPDGVTKIKVECWAGGGAGGQRTTNGGGGGGGGGEYAREDTYTVVPGNVYSYTVGAAGVSGASAGNGGNSSFDGIGVLAHGGVGVAQNVASGGAGGTGSVNAVHFDGGSGFTTTTNGGGGGSSAGPAARGVDATSSTGVTAPTGGGPGGNGPTSGDANGSAPVSGPGGGGGGARRASSGTRVGGSGAPGQVMLTFTQPGNVSATSTETSLFPCAVADPGFTYKLLVFGEVDAEVSLDDGEYPIVNVRVGSTAGQIVASGAGVAEGYQAAAPGSASSQAVFSTPFTAPGSWATIAGWSAVNTGGYSTTMVGNYMQVPATEPATISASVSFSGATAGTKSTVSTAIQIVTNTGTVIATGAQVDGGSGTCTVSWTGTVTIGDLYGIQIGETGVSTYASVASGTFTLATGAMVTNTGPVDIMPAALSTQSPKTGICMLYIDLARSGNSATVTATTLMSSLWVTAVPA